MRSSFLSVVDDIEVKVQDAWDRVREALRQNPDSDLGVFEKEIDTLCLEEDAAGDSVVSNDLRNKVVNFLYPRVLEYTFSEESPKKLGATLINGLWLSHYFDAFSTEDRLTISKRLLEMNEHDDNPVSHANNHYAALQLGGRGYERKEYEDLLVKSLDAAMKIEQEPYRDALAKWIVSEARQVMGEKSAMALVMRKYEVQYEKWTKGINSLVGYMDPYHTVYENTDYNFAPHPGLHTLQPAQS